MSTAVTYRAVWRHYANRLSDLLAPYTRCFRNTASALVVLFKQTSEIATARAQPALEHPRIAGVAESPPLIDAVNLRRDAVAFITFQQQFRGRHR